MVYKKGIHMDSEPGFKEHMEKSMKWDKALALRKERAELKTRLHQIGQEEAKLFGVVEKYRGE